jgi:hypothetical protein
MTENTPTTRAGWAAPTEDPHVHHHFTGDETRSRCGRRFWTGPRGETSPRAVKCEDCQA